MKTTAQIEKLLKSYVKAEREKLFDDIVMRIQEMESMPTEKQLFKFFKNYKQDILNK